MCNLEELIKNSPLIEAESSSRGIQSDLYEMHGGSLYFGTGLTTSKSSSVGVPFDLIGMLCISLEIKRILNLDRVIQLIADTHALSNPFCTTEDVRKISSKMLDISTRVSKVLGMEKIFTPILSSEIDKSEEYIRIFNSIKSEDHEYVRREWADIEYLRSFHDLKLKLSWTIGSDANSIGFDERLYDLRFKEVTGNNMSFLYLLPGRTLDVDRPKVSPYISIKDERRIMLEPNENVGKKILEAQESQGTKLKSSIKHLQDIVDAFEGLYGIVKGENTVEKVQSIIKLVFD